MYNGPDKIIEPVLNHQKGGYILKLLEKPMRLICPFERSSLPSKNFPCISMEMLQIGALLLLGRLVESGCLLFPCHVVDNYVSDATFAWPAETFLDEVNLRSWIEIVYLAKGTPEVVRKIVFSIYIYNSNSILGIINKGGHGQYGQFYATLATMIVK